MEIKDLTKDSGKVTLQGWIHSIRDIGRLKFIQLRDSSGIVQITIDEKSTSKKILDSVSESPPETAIVVEGEILSNPKAKTGLELIPQKLEAVSKSEKELPISVTEKKITTGLSKRLDWRCLDLRKIKQQAIFKIQSALLEGIQTYLYKEGFTQVFTPCLMGVASESGSEVFPIIYFDREAFLRQDPQLHRQLAIAGGLKKIFDIGPAWRAELSHTTKHLCEHRVCAVESAFIKDERDTMRLEEQIIISALKNVNEKCKSELDELSIKIKVPKAPFPELTFPEIYDIIRSKGKEIEDGEDLDTEADKILWEHVKEKHNCEFYFLNRFPSKIKPFYVMRIDDEPEYARSVDLCFKGLELSSGGQREHRYEKIIETLKEKDQSEEETEWFTKFFKYGVPPHGGFAIGIERLTMSLLDVENIRECTLFPRDPERLVP